MKRDIDYGPIRTAWTSLQDARLAADEAQLPAEWGVAGPAVRKAIDLVQNARDNIDGCLNEVKRVLT